MQALVDRSPVPNRLRSLMAKVVTAAREQPLRRIVLALVVPTAVLCLLGALEALGAAPWIFDFDGEGKPLAAWSALVLGSAGVVGIALGRSDREGSVLNRWTVFGYFLVFMAFDEALAIHERFTEFNIDWQRPYAPVIIAGGIAWLLVLRAVQRPRERVLLVAGAASWAVAQFLEYMQWERSRRVDGYSILAGIEETLEVTGSLLFGLALLSAWRATTRVRSRRTASAP